MNNNERMNKLNNAGIDTSKYFNIELPNGLKAGSTISVVINKDGQPVIVNDVIAEQIISDGYVRNTKLHRRFVMAQMFRMLNYVSYDGRKRGYNDYLNLCYAYDYQFSMMLEEVRVLSELEKRDRESFEERSHFFTKDVVVRVLRDYLNDVENYVSHSKTKNCKGIPYKTIKGKNVFVADLNKKIYSPIEREINNISAAKDYQELYRRLRYFVGNMMHLRYDTPKSQAWKDAYKGEGAFYTLKNLIMFHDCKVFGMNTYESMEYINRMLDEYQGEGWRMFALMKKVIADNNFDFNRRMQEIYSK